MITCSVCGSEFRSSGACANHERVRHGLSKRVVVECPCGKTFDVKQSRHRLYCSMKCKGVFHRVWNTGETSSSDVRIMRNAEALSRSLKGKASRPAGWKHTDLTREKMSRNCGGYRRGSGRGKKGWYKGIWCDSSWELAWVMYQLDHGVAFIRNHRTFPYIDAYDRTRHYIPDFFLVREQEYIEIKGWWTDEVVSKLEQFPLRISIIDGLGIIPILSYVRSTYGDDFIRLYDTSGELAE